MASKRVQLAGARERAEAPAKNEVAEQAESSPERPDEVLVTQAQQGDRGAFEVLVLRYQDRVYNVCLRKLGCPEEALDVSQEVFMRAYRAINSFAGKAKFYTWLFRIALNCAFTKRKRRSRRVKLAPLSLDQCGVAGESGSFEPADLRSEPGRLAEQHEAVRLVSSAIATLRRDYQEVVLLRDIDGMSYEEVAAVLELPVGSVKSRLHRARLALKDRLVGVLGDSAP